MRCSISREEEPNRTHKLRDNEVNTFYSAALAWCGMIQTWRWSMSFISSPLRPTRSASMPNGSRSTRLATVDAECIVTVVGAAVPPVWFKTGKDCRSRGSSTPWLQRGQSTWWTQKSPNRCTVTMASKPLSGCSRAASRHAQRIAAPSSTHLRDRVVIYTPGVHVPPPQRTEMQWTGAVCEVIAREAARLCSGTAT
jgi:hypothetical protein